MGLKRLVNGLKYMIFFLFCAKTYLEKNQLRLENLEISGNFISHYCRTRSYVIFFN